MSIQGTPTSGIRWLIDANGRIVGYRNPVSDQDAEVTAGASYLGPMTWAELQASAYADGSVGLAALEADASVFVTDRDVAYIPNDAKTAWTAGKTGELIDVATLAARQVAGTPVPVGTQLIDPTSLLVYGQSDGAGGYVALGGSVPSSEYHTHFYAPLAIDSDRNARDISGALSDGAFQTNLSAATAWATANFLTQPNPTVASELSLIQFPAISWDWASGDSIFVFWVGRGTPEAGDVGVMGESYGFSYGNGLRLLCTSTGKLKASVYQTSGSVSVFGPTSTETVFEASVTHSFAVCVRPHGSGGSGGGMAFWIDGARGSGHASGFVMPSGGPCTTTTANTWKLGGDGQTVGSIQNGLAMQTKALVVLKGRRGRPPAIADMDALVAALHRNPQALVSAEAW